jgi:hypothetical protein
LSSTEFRNLKVSTKKDILQRELKTSLEERRRSTGRPQIEASINAQVWCIRKIKCNVTRLLILILPLLYRFERLQGRIKSSCTLKVIGISSYLKRSSMFVVVDRQEAILFSSFSIGIASSEFVRLVLSLM